MTCNISAFRRTPLSLPQQKVIISLLCWGRNRQRKWSGEGVSLHIRYERPIDHLPEDLWALPVNPWVNQPQRTSIPWQSISKFPNCFSWLPLNAQQPILTHIRRVKSPLNDGWICGASRLCFASCQCLVRQTPQPSRAVLVHLSKNLYHSLLKMNRLYRINRIIESVNFRSGVPPLATEITIQFCSIPD